MLIRIIHRVAAITAILALVVPLATPVAAQNKYFADPAFERIWQRNDRPVELLATTRSWTWGPNSFYAGSEPFKQGRDGRRLVQYFDKARMEVNDTNKERDDPFYVSNGLLVREMVSGKIAVGDKPEDTTTRDPATEAIAGDPASVNEDAPTYATFRDIASLNNDRPSDNRIGERVFKFINKKGDVRDLPREQDGLGDLAKIAVFDPNLRHNIPDKFWSFLIQTGTVYEGGRNVANGSVFQPWEFVMGLPITEPYWTVTKVGGIDRYVLIQLFERRVLTYTPSNRPGFEVEMGNAGQHYYRWRYQLNDGGNPDSGDRPRISDGPRRSALTATSATIEWSTSRETTSHLEYGTDATDLKSRVGTSAYVTTHSVSITGLTANTVYYWRVISRDRDGRIVDDSVHSFKTLAS